MNPEFFIARKIFSGKQLKNNISKPIVKIAIIGIVMGLVVMILSISIVSGFKQEIRKKVIGFGSHIQILNFDSNFSFESVPISEKQDFIPEVKNIPGVKKVQKFATKAGIIKTEEEIHGVVLKGVGKNYDWSFFQKNIVDGECFKVNPNNKSNNAIISKSIADLLSLKTNDEIYTYFIQDPPRIRKFRISGIYDTGLEEFDDIFVLVDIKHIKKLNDWGDDQISGFEVLIDNFKDLDFMTNLVYNKVALNFNKNTNPLKVLSIKEKHPHFFDWINLFDTNVWVILILITSVAGFNMVSGLLILILERTQMIGILKSLGYKNWNIRKIFLYNAFFLIGKGMLWGNLIGLSIVLLQHYTGLIKLDPKSYYVDTVPVNIDIPVILLLNIGTLTATLIMLLIPSFIITKITPVKAIRFT